MKRTERNERAAAAVPTGIRARRAARLRESILRAGLKVFSEKGFRAATMDDIALELEATKGLLYYHFKTKEEILRAILANNSMVRNIEQIFDVLTTMPLRRALMTAAQGALHLMAQNRELVRFLHVQALLSGAEAEVVYTEVIGRLYDGAARVIERFKAAGEVRADVDARHTARLLSDTLISVFFQGELFGKHQLGPEYLEFMIETLLSGIAPVR